MKTRNAIRTAPLFLGAALVSSPVAAALDGPTEEKLYLHMKAAVDRDCDGSLADEAEADRAFATQKSLRPGECVVYRTEYRNDGDFAIRHMRVTNRIPQQMSFVDGSAEYVETPPGLHPETTVAPSETGDAALIWRFGGVLSPGEEGSLRFRAKLTP